MKSHNTIGTIAIFAAGCFVRYALTLWPWTLEWLQNRIEIATPLTRYFYGLSIYVSFYQIR